MQIIQENQYRIFAIFIYAGFLLGLIYIFFLANISFAINDIIKNPMNWAIVFVGYLMYKGSGELVTKVWRQTGIRDNIEKQTEIKLKHETIKIKNEIINLELKQLKLIKDLGFKINEEKLPKSIRKLLKK